MMSTSQVLRRMSGNVTEDFVPSGSHHVCTVHRSSAILSHGGSMFSGNLEVYKVTLGIQSN